MKRAVEFVYKEGRRNIWHLCMERCVMIFPTFTPVHSETWDPISQASVTLPSYCCFFSSLFFSLLAQLMLKRSGAHMEERHLGRWQRNNNLIWFILLHLCILMSMFEVIYNVKQNIVKFTIEDQQRKSWFDFLYRLTGVVIWWFWKNIDFVEFAQRKVCVPYITVF